MADDNQSSDGIQANHRAGRSRISGAEQTGSWLVNRLLTVLGVYFPEAGRLLGANLSALAWVGAGYLLISLTLLALMGLSTRIFGSPWPALALGRWPALALISWPAILVVLILLILLVIPLVRLIICHLALNIWDDGEASLTEAVSFARSNYLDSLGAALSGLWYEWKTLIRFIGCWVPGLALGAGLHWLLPYSGVELKMGWKILIAGAVTVILTVYYLWGEARRVNTFLYRFNAFEILDGQSVFSQDIVEGSGGNWRSRFARMYHHLGQGPFPHEFNMPLAVALAAYLIWVPLAVWILAADWQPLSKIYLLALGPLMIRFLIGLWYTIAAAGYYRANLATEDYRYGRG